MKQTTTIQIAASLRTKGMGAAKTLSSKIPKRLGDWLQWNAQVPLLGGVYVLWRNRKPVYVGETCNLWDRIYEMAERGRHNALPKLVSLKEKRVRGIALTKLKSVQSLGITWHKLDLGRKEIEEYLVSKWRKRVVNKEDGRFVRRKDAPAFKQLEAK